MKFEEEKVTAALRMAFSRLEGGDISDTARINAFLMDFIPSCPNERKLVISAMRQGVGDGLRKRLEEDNSEYKLYLNSCVRELTESLFLAPEAAQFAVRAIFNALRVPIAAGGTNGAELMKGAFHKTGAEFSEWLPFYDTIGYKAFAADTELTQLEIPEQIRVIRSKAFFKCANLKRIILPKGLTGLGAEVFSGCDALSEIGVSENPVYAVSGGMLYDIARGVLLRAANSVGGACAVPENIVSIGRKCFEKSRVTEITLPAGLAAIASDAFAGCEGLRGFKISSAGSNFGVLDGVLYNGDMTALVKFPAGRGDVNFILDSGVKRIADEAFSGAAGLRSITFTGGLRSIGRKAFSCCEGLTNVMLPMGVRSVEEGAFQYCAGLTGVMLPQGIEEIGALTFYGCASLESVTIPQSVTYIGNAAFKNCSRLGRAVIRENVRYIGDGVFDGCPPYFKALIANNEYAARYCDVHNINWDVV